MKSADAPHYPSGEQPHASSTGDQTAANDGSMISLRSLLWGAALSCVGVLLISLASRLEPDHGGAFLIAVAAVCIFASFGFFASWIHPFVYFSSGCLPALPWILFEYGDSTNAITAGRRSTRSGDTISFVDYLPSRPEHCLSSTKLRIMF